MNKKIAKLKELKDVHYQIIAAILKAYGGKIFAIDFMAVAVIQRSISLIDGFVLLVEARNALCAAPLIRLQIDSLMRLNACRLVDDPYIIVRALLEGTPLYKVKSKDGDPLTDKYLRRKISEIHPWVERIYKKASGFVHLSGPHMVASFSSVNSDTGEMEMFIGSDHGRKWTDSEIEEAIDAFSEATTAILHFCYSMLKTKEEVARNKLPFKQL